MTEGLAEKYVEYGRTRRNDLWWAWQEVNDLVIYKPEEGWPLVLELVRLAPDDEVLNYVAAGPLEDILTEHGETLLSDLRTAAKNDARLRRALGGVWNRKSMKSEVWKEVQRLGGHGPN